MPVFLIEKVYNRKSMDCALLILLFSVSAGGRKGSVCLRDSLVLPTGVESGVLSLFGERFKVPSPAESATELHLKGPEG